VDLLLVCARAWRDLPADSRERFSARLHSLPTRWSTKSEIAELVRFNFNAEIFAPLIGNEELGFSAGERAFNERYVDLASWNDIDIAMRKLQAGDASAVKQIDQQFQPWWDISGIGNYGELRVSLEFIEENQRFIDVLPWLANGARGEPPSGSRVDGGVEVEVHGGVLFLPVPAE
jgi:hypothetical protein